MSIYELINIRLKKRIHENKKILLGLEPLVITRFEWIMWQKYISYIFKGKAELVEEMPDGYIIHGKKVVVND